MRTSYIAILVLTGALIVSTCSSTSDNPPKERRVSSTAGNENTAGVGNGAELSGPRQVEANAATSSASAEGVTSPVNSVKGKLDAMKQEAVNQPKVDPAVVAARNAKPAPDNSTFTSYLADAGYEIRTFKNHPQLLKVEKKIAPDGTQTLKVFLRSGKVVDLPGQSIHPLSTASAAVILAAAGIQMPSDTRPSGKDEKKAGI